MDILGENVFFFSIFLQALTFRQSSLCVQKATYSKIAFHQFRFDCFYSMILESTSVIRNFAINIQTGIFLK